MHIYPHTGLFIYIHTYIYNIYNIYIEYLLSIIIYPCPQWTIMFCIILEFLTTIKMGFLSCCILSSLFQQTTYSHIHGSFPIVVWPLHNNCLLFLSFPWFWFSSSPLSVGKFFSFCFLQIVLLYIFWNQKIGLYLLTSL